MADTPPPRPTALRLLLAVPLIGHILRDLLYRGRENVWYFLLMVVSLWGIAILEFGLPGLALPAVALTPLILLVLVVVTRG